MIFSAHHAALALKAAKTAMARAATSLRAGGWLPYTLRIKFRTTESRYPNGLSMGATGNLEGRGIWTFEQDGPFVNVTYDWTIRANKPIIDKLSFLMKPIFRSNHNWPMKRGEESLRLELLRRRDLRWSVECFGSHDECGFGFDECLNSISFSIAFPR